MFTPHERRQLQIIEEWFEQDDPQLAQALRSGPVKRQSAIRHVLTICLACAMGVLGAITGAFALILGSMLAGVAAGCMIALRHKKDS